MAHGTWIPKAVLDRADIPLSARVLYGLIDALDGDEGCYASNGWIATNLGLSKRQIQNLITILMDNGLVHRYENDGKRYLQTVEKAALKSVNKGEVDFTPPTKPISPPPCNSLHPYSTEDKIEDKTNPLPLPHSEIFRKVWNEWVNYRSKTKKKLSVFARDKQLEMLTAMSEREAIACIERSIANDWQGLFPEKGNSKSFGKILTREDHSNGF